ncbi:MAG: transcriptional regulator [Promethearchaeota archaeon]|nr:MAG: transcriptional regulator [Candidatus Lokiarchaeota archaeon]
MKIDDIYNSAKFEETLQKAQGLGREILDDYFSRTPYSNKEKEKEVSFFYEDLEFIRKKWILEILWELETYKGSNFNELKRAIKGISSRSLSDRLKDLEKNGIVERNVEDSRPPSVLYKLTENGEGFVELMILVILFLKRP